jgi:hypothetical protein
MRRFEPNTRPTDFFYWCAEEHFGVQSPKSAWVQRSAKNLTSGEIGIAIYRAWTPCKSEEDARQLMRKIAAELRRIAKEKGCTLQDHELSPNQQWDSFELAYRIGLNYGTLVGKCERGDTTLGGKSDNAYFLKLKLSEVILQP